MERLIALYRAVLALMIDLLTVRLATYVAAFVVRTYHLKCSGMLWVMTYGPPVDNLIDWGGTKPQLLLRITGAKGIKPAR